MGATDQREVWLVRHGETEWSRDGKHTSHTDLELTEPGVEVARTLAGRLSGHSFSLVLTSPRRRAVHTAELAGFTDAVHDDDLVEWDYGDYEGVTTADIREERPGWYLFRDGCPGGESPDDVGARTDRVIERVLPVLDGGSDAALVAHGHVLRVLAARWVEEPAAFGGRLWLATGSLSVLGFEREVRVLRSWNEEQQPG